MKDALARGAKSAQFSTGGKSMTDKQWQAIFGQVCPPKKRKRRKKNVKA